MAHMGDQTVEAEITFRCGPSLVRHLPHLMKPQKIKWQQYQMEDEDRRHPAEVAVAYESDIALP